MKIAPKSPPNVLYHGTAKHYVESIMEAGIKSGNRDFVHLSAHRNEAQKVGSRHGKPVVIEVRSADMNCRGYDFYQSISEAEVWLTKGVPAEFLSYI